jgi:hypothetical protein
MLKDTPVNLSEDLYGCMAHSIYKIKNPAIQFLYDPNFFVLESFQIPSKAPQSELDLVIITYLWRKEDYLTLKNAGDELGDFPPRLSLSVHENPEGLSLEAWIATQGSSVFNAEIEKVQEMINMMKDLGQPAWYFSYCKSLLEYNNIIFKDANDRVIAISVGLPPGTFSDLDAETIKDDDDYFIGFSLMATTMKLAPAAPN